MSLLSRFANAFRSRKVDRDIEEELQSHFEDAQAEGREPVEAGRAFGSRLRAHEAVRDAIVAPWMESLLADARFGLRQLWKQKGTTAAAVLSLGLGMGASMAAFRLIDAFLLRPLPVANTGSLYVFGTEGRDERGQPAVQYSFDYPGFRQLREAVKDQASMMAIADPQRVNLTYSSDEAMERVYMQYLSGRTFADFGLQPAAGRLFVEDDDVTPGTHPYAVLSYDYWVRRFGKDPDVLGRKFRTGNDFFEIVGVAPEGFTGTEPGMFTDLYAPTMMYNPEALGNQNWHWFKPWVRVRPGVDIQEVRERLGSALLIHRQEQVKMYPQGTPQKQIDEYLRAPVILSPAAAGVSDLQRNYGRSLEILGLLVAMVLLIACVNVANLMTAQAAARAREMALRVSIGAGRARLIQLVMVESTCIACAAAALGIAFAWWAAPFVVGMINPVDAPVRLALPADGRVTGFAVMLTGLVTMLFGLAPALRASGVRAASALKGGDNARSRPRLMAVLVAAQVGFCVVVQLVAGLFVSTFQRLANQPLGFSPARVITLESVTPADQRPELWYQVADRLRSLPRVENASVATFALMSGSGWNGNVWANGRTPAGFRAPWFLGVSPGWLDTMRIPLLDGRQLRPDDTFPRVAIVNQTFARRYFDGQSPVGKTLETMAGGTKRVALQIVGLAADARYTGMRGPIPATVYVPFRAVDEQAEAKLENHATFLVRTKDANPMSLAASFRQEVKQAGSGFRVANIRTQDELVRAQTIRERLLATLSIFFSVIALVLAGVGLYGVLNYAVTERQRELGIRIALGAGVKDIVGRVTVRIFAMIALGVAGGLAIGISIERFIDSLLFGVKATDPSILLWAALAIVAAAALAAFPAVLRALRIDPASLLRAE